MSARSGRNARPDPHPRDELPAYLLEELSPTDMRSVADHLRDCEGCQEELADLQATFVAAVEELPGDGPRPRVLEGVHTRIADEGGGRSPGASRAPRGASRPRGRPRGAAPPRWAGALIVAVVLTAGVGAWSLWESLARSRGDLLEARNRIETLENERAALAEWLARPQVAMRQLPASEAPQEGTFAQGSMLMLPDGRTLVVMRDTPRADRAYQAWGVQGDEVTSLGVFEERTITVPAQGFEAVAVSLEPAGGSETPTEILGAVPTG